MPVGQEILIALGANMDSPYGGPVETLSSALSRLPELGLAVRAVSKFYETPCFPAGAGPDYVNACAHLTAVPSPEAVLAALHQIEAEHDRKRDRRWGARSLDLDLLAIGGKVLPSLKYYQQWRDLSPEAQGRLAPEQLILPHPRLQDRGFVLVPLLDVAPDWCHPVSGQTVRQMHDALPAEARAEVKPI
ncbi:2-amino-4-hydroxy-6-hydroxymethyldihydropteridine diphosphokinase [Salipiger sp. 1_MG-2023]|nr:2-amino-4-hydroxy-6-hydroxymethyldihydropteridine diphosphokinase [Salipiger sp. 1_MG-2023]MDO6584211.1 2-amino-4-hydroxy-6-hydroxymethyldihydropteridine diphosphokinase [Salipiger sp. 1_MG-2023]